MKGLLVRNGLEPPQTHDLTVLRTLLPADWNVPSSLPDLTVVTRWQVMVRYPEVEADSAERLPTVGEALAMVDELNERLETLTRT